MILAWVLDREEINPVRRVDPVLIPTKVPLESFLVGSDEVNAGFTSEEVAEFDAISHSEGTMPDHRGDLEDYERDHHREFQRCEAHRTSCIDVKTWMFRSTGRR